MLQPAVRYLVTLGVVLWALSIVLAFWMVIRLKRIGERRINRADLGRRYTKAFPESSMARYYIACQIVGLLLVIAAVLARRYKM
jgi:hypothetical protein